MPGGRGLQALAIENRVLFVDQGVKDAFVLLLDTHAPGCATNRMQHFGFRLNDKNHDRVIAQVEAAGGKLVSRGKHGGRFPYAYVSDPDGYVVEIWYELPTPIDPKR